MFFSCIQCATCLHWSMHYLMPELASSRTMLCHAICSHSKGRLHIVTAQSVPPIHIFVFLATCTMTPPINAHALRKAGRTIGSDMYNTTIIDLKLTCCVLTLMSGSQICQSSRLAWDTVSDGAIPADQLSDKICIRTASLMILVHPRSRDTSNDT